MLQHASRPSSPESSAAPPCLPCTDRLFAQIDTPRARLQLVRAGIRSGWPGRYVYQPSARDNEPIEQGWLWEAIGTDGESLGFIGLVPAPPTGGLPGIFGPVLVVTLKRALPAGEGSELIGGLMTWLERNHICHVVHADHAEGDPQLAAWLVGAGFLHTGRHEDDGSRSMVLIL